MKKSSTPSSPYATKKSRHGNQMEGFPLLNRPKDNPKQREMAWNTSFPAEYHPSHNPKADYAQTLAFQEHEPRHIITNNRKSQNLPLVPQTKQQLEVLKQITVREGLLTKLKQLMQPSESSIDHGTELLHLLLQLRDASVQVMSALSQWYQHTPPPFVPFPYPPCTNYCIKMVSDLNFLALIPSIRQVLGVDPNKMKQNPFMMPTPITEREIEYRNKTKNRNMLVPPCYSFQDPVDRVPQAEKYLIWCLVHIPDVPSTNIVATPTSPTTVSSPPRTPGLKSPLTWQERAEKQLRLLSMPMTSASGHLHVMDSSCMMKRKGYLPSLSTSPPKTLTQLVDNVHHRNEHSTSPIKKNVLEVRHESSGITYRTTASELEILGGNEVSPHHLVTLVTASVLILLSPSDRIPKDLSWTSCRKMLSDGVRLIRTLDHIDPRQLPTFKWKALLPFQENQHFQPLFLMEYASAAAVLCAWVLKVLATAQDHDKLVNKTDADRHEILNELEQEKMSLSSVASTKSEVLFIDENHPVSSSTPRQPVSTPHPAASASQSSNRIEPGCLHVLLGTSPWTHRGITYFVSFFLERMESTGDNLTSGSSDSLSIKLYEPMSSVESQMFVTAEEIEQEFGAQAREYFRRREFSAVCELILEQFETMMRKKTPSSGSDQGGRSEDKPKQDFLSKEERAAVRIQCLARQKSAQKLAANKRADRFNHQQHHAAVRIQSVARQRAARRQVERYKKEKNATVTIQCAVRQRQARDQVKHVRFTRQAQHELTQHCSAIKIQSIARKRQAQKHVRNLKLLQRTPPGLSFTTNADDEMYGDDTELAVDAQREMISKLNALIVGGVAHVEPHNNEEETRYKDDVCRTLENVRVDDGVALHPLEIIRSIPPTRPDTSYSEHFEEDFESEE